MANTQRATSYARKSSDGTLEGIEQRDRHGRVICLGLHPCKYYEFYKQCFNFLLGEASGRNRIQYIYI